MALILVVDDHSDIRRLLSVTLGREHTILEAEDGATALGMVRHHHPDLVLLDVMMPGALDGLQVLQAIKGSADTQATLVAMVTARGQVADCDEASALGADAYFVKPFSPLQVVNWVRSVLA